MVTVWQRSEILRFTQNDRITLQCVQDYDISPLEWTFALRQGIHSLPELTSQILPELTSQPVTISSVPSFANLAIASLPFPPLANLPKLYIHLLPFANIS